MQPEITAIIRPYLAILLLEVEQEGRQTWVLTEMREALVVVLDTIDEVVQVM
jgi:hypothetical protein